MRQVVKHLAQGAARLMSRVVTASIGWHVNQRLLQPSLMGHAVPLPPNQGQHQAQGHQPSQSGWKTLAFHDSKIIARSIETAARPLKMNVMSIPVSEPSPLRSGEAALCEIARPYIED